MNELRVMAIDAGAVDHAPEAALRVVAESGADVVAVTGAPRYLRWRSKRAKIARQLGLVVTTADRVGGMFVATTLRVDIKDTSFHTSSSSAGTSPAVIGVTFNVRGGAWRLIVAATGGAADFPANEIPAVIVGGVGGPGAITVDRTVTVHSCGPVGASGLSVAPTLAVLQR